MLLIFFILGPIDAYIFIFFQLVLFFVSLYYGFLIFKEFSWIKILTLNIFLYLLCCIQ